jgi:type I restriction enzyme S subunit
MRAEVPEGWQRVRLGEVAEVRSGVTKNTKRQLSDPVEVPYLRVANVQDGYLDLDEMKTIRIERRDLSRYRLQAGDVVMNEGGDIDKLGRGAVWNGQVDPCVHQNHVFSVRCHVDRLLPTFLAAAAESQIGKTYFMEVGKQTTNLACINKTLLRQFPLPLPPLPEQKKIAAILSSVDEAIQATQAVIEQTRMVKEGLLQELLTRGIGHTRFKQSPIGEIPEGWAVKRLGALGEVQYGLTVNKARRDSPRRYPYLRVADVNNGSIRLTELAEIGVVEGDLETYSLRRGDLLLVEGNANVDRLGQPAVYAGDGPAPLLHQNHLIRVRLSVENALEEWVAACLRSPAGRKQIRLEAKTSSGLSTINSSVVRNLRLPLPALSEQRAIVARLRSCEQSAGVATTKLNQLQQLKAGLLQDLLTGKVRVSQ